MALTDLMGYPMVMAVSEDAINGQMAKVYGESSTGANTFPNVPWDLQAKDDSWEVVVDSFSAPKVDFDTTVANGCRLIMTINSGHFTAFTVKMVKHKPVVDKVETALDGITLYVTTPMKQIKHDTWSDEEFEVQGLFADLENLHKLELSLSKDIEAAIGGTMKSSLETVLSDRIKAMGKKDPQGLLFGAVKIPVIDKSKQSTGPLRPSANTFSTCVQRAKDGKYESGDLNYLCLIGGDTKLPGDATAGKFNHSLRSPAGSDATLVVSKATLLGQFLKPILNARWPEASLSLTRGTYGLVDAKLYLSSDYSFKVKLDGNERDATLTKCESTIKGSKIVTDYAWNSSISHWSGDIDVTVTGSQTIEISNVNGKLTQTVTTPDPHIDTDSNWFTRILGDIITLGFDEIGRANTKDSGEGDIDSFCENLDSGAKKVFGTMVLPGQQVWRYSSAVLSGQLFLAASYK